MQPKKNYSIAQSLLAMIFVLIVISAMIGSGVMIGIIITDTPVTEIEEVISVIDVKSNVDVISDIDIPVDVFTKDDTNICNLSNSDKISLNTCLAYGLIPSIIEITNDQGVYYMPICRLAE